MAEDQVKTARGRWIFVRIVQKTLGWSLLIVLVLTIVMLMALSWVALTESGTRWALSKARDFLPAELTYGEVRGALASPFTLQDLHYESDGLRLAVDSATVQWQLLDLLDRRLRVGQLRARNIELQLGPGAENSASEPVALPELPLEIELQQLEVSGFTVVSAPGAEPLVIDSLSAAALWDKEQLAVTDLALRSAVADLDASAKLTFPQGLQALALADSAARLTASELSVDARYRLSLSSLAALEGEAKLQGEISDVAFELTAKPPYGVKLQGSVRDVLSRWQTDLQLQVSRAQLGAISAGWPGWVVGYAAQITGNASELLLTGSGSFAEKEHGRYETSVQLVYSPQRLRIENAAVSQVGGKLPLRLRANGLIELSDADPVMDVALQWQQLHWPLVQVPTVRSKQGKLTLAGSLAAYSAQLSAHLSVPNQTDGEVSLVGFGSDQHFETESLLLRTLNGRVSGSLRADWRSGLQSKAALTVVGIDPSGLAPEWPGAVDGQVQLSTSQVGSDTPIRWVLESLQLGGTLRGTALKGDLALNYEGGRLVLQRGELALGKNQLSLGGQAKKAFALTYDLQAPDLATLWPGNSGAVSASGSITGERNAPVVKTELQLNDVLLEGRRLGSAKLIADLGLDPDYVNSLRLDAQAYQDEAFALRTASLRLQGSQLDHRLDVAIDTELAQVQLALLGQLVDFGAGQGDKTRYDFRLQELQLQPAEQPTWQLKEGGVGRVSLAAAELEQICLQSDPAQLCLAANWQSSATATLQLALQTIPLERLNAWLPADLQITGQFGGGGSVFVADSVVSADLRFATTRISLFADADSSMELETDAQETAAEIEPLITFEPGQLSLLAEPAQPVQLDFNLPLSEGGGLRASMSLRPDVQIPVNSEISGSAQAKLPDVRVVGELLPQVSRLQGTLSSDLAVVGTVAEPVITGLLNFTDGEATLLGPDITLKDIELSVSGTDTGSGEPVPLTVNGRVRSGDGSLSLTGQVLYSGSDVNAELALKGERFQMMNNKLAQVYASPDLALSLRGQRLGLRGKIAIPEADIVLKRVPESAVVVSDDQILISEDDIQRAAGRYTYAAAVTLALGDAVQFEGFGLDARFAGDLQVQQSSGEPALGNGEIRIEEGRYQAYGQDLKIETGRALWTDSPLSEPGIDLKAIRNPRPDITVGVRARGLLAKPEFSLFSEPGMGESDQLSYLVLGRPLQDNSTAETSLLAQAALALGIRGGNFLSDQFGGALGVDQIGIETAAGSGSDSAAFVVGKYLSPKLYVSYGLGLLDSVSTLKLEYLLSSKWRLVTESSTIDSGGDLIYTIERD